MHGRARSLLVFAALLLALLAGCDTLLPPRAKLVGKWKLDTEATKSESLSLLASIFPSEIEYRSDGVVAAQVNMLFRTATVTGVWSVENESGQKATVKEQWQGMPLPRTYDIEFIDADHFRALTAPPGGQTVAVVFSRNLK
jgi:hypothetical protein